MKETWQPIPGYPEYEASTMGRIRSLKRREPHVLSPYKDRYAIVSVMLDGQQDVKAVHQLVALAFMGPTPDGMHIEHKNGDLLDNRPSNLVFGPKRGYRRATIHKVRSIREKAAKGTHLVVIANEYDLSLEYVQNIAHGNLFKDVGGPTVTPEKILDESEVMDIYAMRDRGCTLMEIGEKYGRTESSISRICSGKTYKRYFNNDPD
jgi:hypothetical protein